MCLNICKPFYKIITRNFLLSEKSRSAQTITVIAFDKADKSLAAVHSINEDRPPPHESSSSCSDSDSSSDSSDSSSDSSDSESSSSEEELDSKQDTSVSGAGSDDSVVDKNYIPNSDELSSESEEERPAKTPR